MAQQVRRGVLAYGEKRLDMTKLTEELEAYGVNLTEVMERFVNDEEFYADCLLSFMEDPSFEALGSALEEQNFSEAFDYAHTLKGVAGNLGLTPLFNAICGIVEPLRSKEFSNVGGLYKTVLDEKERLQNLINEAK
jgi:HPt (histidine-containing phosphotransfer) domain-containing protein